MIHATATTFVRPIRTVLILRGYNSYRLGCIEALAARPEVQLRVWFLDEQRQLNGWPEPTFDLRFLRGLRWAPSRDRLLAVVPTLIIDLARARPEVIVVSELSVSTLQVAIYARLARRPFVIWSGATATQAAVVGRFRRWLRRRLVQAADTFVAYGSSASEYLHELGARPYRVYLALTTTNLDQWASWAETVDPRPGDGTITALFVGQLIRRKQPEVILALASLARDQHLDVRFQVVGSGDLRAELEGQAREQGLDTVEFLGELPPPELAELYAKADCLLFPTRADIWGLVVNEAMACGLVPVVSPNAECHRDLIVNGHNGFVVDFDHLDDVLAIIQLSRSEPDQWAGLRVSAREDVFRLASASRWADGFVSAITSALRFQRGPSTRT